MKTAWVLICIVYQTHGPVYFTITDIASKEACVELKHKMLKVADLSYLNRTLTTHCIEYHKAP